MEHANVALQLAESWSSPSLREYRHHRDLMHVIEHHDDGWLEWESQPDLDPENGLPRQFTDMPTDLAMQISEKCVLSNADRGPKCAYWVAQHFRHLADQRDDLSDTERRRVNQFLEFTTRFIENSDSIAPRDELDFGTDWLQFFDLLSLLLCCRVPDEPDSADTPDGIGLSLSYRTLAELSVSVEVTPATAIRPFQLNVPGRIYTAGSAIADSAPATLTISIS